MPSRRRRRPRVATQAVELALAVPQVMSHRLARLARAGASPTARDRREFERMGVEKLFAFYESWNAMLLELFRVNLDLALSPFRIWSFGRGRQRGLRILGAGLAPIHRRATANARRLRRRHVA